MWLFRDVLEKNKRVFKVPVYQRNYDWTNIQCEKLFQDIVHAGQRNIQHFTGTIVYIDDINGGSGLNEVLIIDGQQRITTLYILLKALCDVSKDSSDSIAAEIEDVMYNKYCEEKYKIKLKPVKTDDKQLQFLINNQIEKMDRNSNVYKNYIVFKDLIEKTIAGGSNIREIFEGVKQLEVVEIILDKQQGDDPQKIFESINSTGLDLSLADLIRNYLLMDDKNQDELYEDYWLEIEKNVGYNNLGDFVINYLNSQITRNVNAKNAYRLFKENCESNKYSHKDVLTSLRKTSKYYGAFFGLNNDYNQEIMKYLNAFRTIKQTTIIPLLFRIFDDYENKMISDQIICNVLNYLLTYLIRMNACEINKNMGKFMKSLYSRAFDNNYDHYYEKLVIFLNDTRSTDRMPTDREFKEALITKPLYKKNICKYLLSVIENSTKEHIDVSNLTIEHILPQKENAATWVKEVGEDYETVYDVYLHTLGNLTITGHNSELGTKSFAQKKEIIKENSKANILNKDVLNAKRWDKEAILNRANSLADLVIQQFKYVDRHEKAKNTKLTYNVNSDIDFTNKKPDEFVFEGEPVKVKNWVELLSKMLDMAYDLSPDVIKELASKNFSISNAKKIYISNDKRKISHPKQISTTGIYFESRLSSKQIISLIKDVILKMQLEAEDFTFSLFEDSFDINDESTWTKANISIAQLFYNFMKSLIENSLIDSKEIESLKSKEDTKKLFHASDYPALANHRNDNMGNSDQKRYRATPIIIDGSNIFVSTQFFETDRQAVIDWYKSHLS